MYVAGNKVGNMTLLERLDEDYWKCRCDCGMELQIAEKRLTLLPPCPYNPGNIVTKAP